MKGALYGALKISGALRDWLLSAALWSVCNPDPPDCNKEVPKTGALWSAPEFSRPPQSCAVAIALSNNGGCTSNWPDFVGIVLLLLINLVIGFYKERGAANANEALMDLLASKAKVRHNGAVDWSSRRRTSPDLGAGSQGSRVLVTCSAVALPRPVFHSAFDSSSRFYFSSSPPTIPLGYHSPPAYRQVGPPTRKFCSRLGAPAFIRALRAGSPTLDGL
ncbi:Cation transporter/ATPase, N-terminus [Rhizoctonia solani]|uniref:Cation transporter/ATPase, N-terminus n=1 Tax=Rhizoctonia solani TaxID=456999 RepID=A0A8H7IKH4_9AGAM|nr:Cation transporter/ATPase, N-terminus [Rhizoctonia solani]